MSSPWLCFTRCAACSRKAPPFSYLLFSRRQRLGVCSRGCGALPDERGPPPSPERWPVGSTTRLWVGLPLQIFDHTLSSSSWTLRDWCLLFVSIRQGLGGAGRPQLLIDRPTEIYSQVIGIGALLHGVTRGCGDVTTPPLRPGPKELTK